MVKEEKKSYGDPLRDAIAIEAMHALIRQLPLQMQGTVKRSMIAIEAYRMADEMLKARQLDTKS